jgi:methylmalonyl-CoA/ethylmalonyl-CoA epimerase
MKAPFKETEAVMVMQVCFLTEDIDATLRWFCQLLDKSVPPVNEQPDPEIARTQYKGAPAEVGFRQALMKWRGTQLEFIQPDHRPSVWRDWLNEHGPGIHHVGFAVGNFEDARASLADLGLPIIQEGAWPTGRYAYADARPEVGAFVEILDVDADEVRTHGMD